LQLRSDRTRFTASIWFCYAAVQTGLVAMFGVARLFVAMPISGLIRGRSDRDWWLHHKRTKLLQIAVDLIMRASQRGGRRRIPLLACDML